LSLTTKSPCPVCGTEIEFSWEPSDIPHFGEAMLIAGVCEGCGFRHSDTILLTSKEPSRYVLEVECLEDLDARVIRSCSGTIRIPELGVDVEPGAASESYVTNVEGVLDRIEGIVEFATRTAREAGAVDKALHGEEILEKIASARNGMFKFKLVIEDPLGNSAIDSEKAVKSPLTEEEVACLKSGMTVLDI